MISAERRDDHWEITLRPRDGGAEEKVKARMIVNAGGPWVGDIIQSKIRSNSREGVRLVRGSHIVTRKLFDHDKAYFFQGEDGRIIFAIPYEGEFTLIGTTDKEHADPSQPAQCSPEERDYLRTFASQYFKTEITPDDVVWTYSGVRPLYDDGARSVAVFAVPAEGLEFEDLAPLRGHPDLWYRQSWGFHGVAWVEGCLAWSAVAPLDFDREALVAWTAAYRTERR